MFEYEYESRSAEYEYGRSSTLKKNVLVLVPVLENQNRSPRSARHLLLQTPRKHQL